MSQTDLVLKHLKNTGSITMREAMLDYSIQCLTKRIQELRQRGIKIKTMKCKHPMTKQRYARYVLQGKPLAV